MKVWRSVEIQYYSLYFHINVDQEYHIYWTRAGAQDVAFESRAKSALFILFWADMIVQWFWAYLKDSQNPTLDST